MMSDEVLKYQLEAYLAEYNRTMDRNVEYIKLSYQLAMSAAVIFGAAVTLLTSDLVAIRPLLLYLPLALYVIELLQVYLDTQLHLQARSIELQLRPRVARIVGREDIFLLFDYHRRYGGPARWFFRPWGLLVLVLPLLFAAALLAILWQVTQHPLRSNALFWVDCVTGAGVFAITVFVLRLNRHWRPSEDSRTNIDTTESSALMSVNWEETDPRTLSTLCSEAQGEIQRQLQNADSLDSKATALLGAGSLVSALIGAVQLTILDPSRLTGLPCFARIIVVAIAIALFIAWFVPTVLVIRTYAFKTTLEMSEEQIVQNYLPLTSDWLDRQLLYNYLRAIGSNDEILWRKGRLSNIATYLLAANVIYLLLIGLLSFLGPGNSMPGG